PAGDSTTGDSTATLAEWTANWRQDAEAELKKIPFFVRGKARKNTELYAREKGISPITLETLYNAKAHFGR
ncbi:MAG TPA: ferredoxin:protochlorophyllide reductase (ATP-dependent) subunit B, partial [Rhodospirillaceae bacterium]|nr:ferredoxin:protochlorophyllide reductase (ATP-dependent) subunit B [Rhodospirillaceae bacterium]